MFIVHDLLEFIRQEEGHSVELLAFLDLWRWFVEELLYLALSLVLVVQLQVYEQVIVLYMKELKLVLLLDFVLINV